LYIIRNWASWSDSPLGNELIVKLGFLYLSIKILSVAVDEELSILVGKSKMLCKPYDARRASNCHLFLVLSR